MDEHKDWLILQDYQQKTCNIVRIRRNGVQSSSRTTNSPTPTAEVSMHTCTFTSTAVAKAPQHNKMCICPRFYYTLEEVLERHPDFVSGLRTYKLHQIARVCLIESESAKDTSKVTNRAKGKYLGLFQVSELKVYFNFLFI
ncbi:lysozyme-like domain superfamily [Holotrichia oblita]|uniref:Lysozyme-like domain superfamily n=1 Tax=Holotrichia oblita TaxID=644536 RepID=A0ACB9TKI0_HOLOL|nr:lysozyme-like domain superfamily [Holotrichia oblita]